MMLNLRHIATAAVAALTLSVSAPLHAQDIADAQDAAVDPGAVRVLVRSVDAGEMERVVLLRGVTAAARQVEVRAQTGGLVVSEPKRRGALVTKGETLCQIEPAERELRLAEAKARLTQAEADAAASERLVRSGVTSETKLAADRAALAAAQATVAQMELDLQRLTIVAPFDGVLETDAAEIGALLQSGSICAEVIAIDPIHFVGYAAEEQVRALKIGGTARARLLDGRVVEATISFVSRSADSATRTFRVEATAANPEGFEGGQLRDGMTTELTIPVAALEGHLVPGSALTLDPEGRIGVRVAVAEGEDQYVARFKPVAILGDVNGGVWIGGLAPTEMVIIRGQEYVTDGTKIAPVIEEEDAAQTAHSDS